MSDEQVIEQTQQIETQAREMGWRPQEEFKGDAGKWVDAKTFVEKGEHVLPIVKATNERLRNDLTRTNTELSTIKQALADSQKTIQALEKYHQDDVKQKVEKARADLKAQLVAAKKAGDVEGEVELTEELGRLNTADAAAAAAAITDTKVVKTNEQQAVDYTQHPDFVAWKNDNPWFLTDRTKTIIANDVTDRLRANGDTRTGRAFLDAVAVEVTKEVARLGGGGRSSPRVEGSRGGAGGTTNTDRAKTYADLPADAKAACDGYQQDLVGPNKKYKTAEEWRKSYVEQYYREV